MNKQLANGRLFIALIALMSMPLAMDATTTAAKPASAAVSAPTQLRVDDLVTPLGLDHAAPRFAWILQDGSRGAKQSAYQVQVGLSRSFSAGKANVWDSGKIESAQSLGVLYQGPALKPSTRYYWRVMSWDKNGKPYPTSQVSWWETGLMSAETGRPNGLAIRTGKRARFARPMLHG